MKAMSRSDELLWQNPLTLPALGELMAQWLEGKIESRPGYRPRTGPDPETHETIRNVLARANRAGFVTTDSQPGLREIVAGGGLLVQRAAVTGFADDATLRELADEAAARGLGISYGKARKRRSDHRNAVPVTWQNGKVFTEFGSIRSQRAIRDPWVGFGVCSLDVVERLTNAWQVTLYDHQVADDHRLWMMLGYLFPA